MHPSAEYLVKTFLNNYINPENSYNVIEVGCGVDTFIRSNMPSNVTYTGLDFAVDANADIHMTDQYTIPLADNSIDMVISSSCFANSEMFWLLFKEMMRVLKPSGLIYTNTPSAGQWTRQPVDCWRFYPDAGKALANYAKREGNSNCELVESFLCHYDEHWHDFVSVHIKDSDHITQYPTRIFDTINQEAITNAFVYGVENIQLQDDDFEMHRAIWRTGERLL